MPAHEQRKNMRLIISLLVLCAMCMPTLSAETKGPEIAVLRLDEVIRNSKLYLARIDQLKKDKADAEAQLKQMEEQLQALENKLQVLSPTSDKFAQAQEELEVIKVKRELLGKRVKFLLERRHGAVLKEAFDVARGHLSAFAKERSIRLVTLAPNPDLPNLSSNDMQMQLGLQVALYYDPSLDITEAFIAFANSRYTGDAPGPIGSTPGPTVPANAAPSKPVGP
jgi:Skp family chaperone for outer membrane proteins